ncbi:6-phospho-3-hexuloisomerase [Pseudonocardia alni]|jgi:6-phospho-3-hexuloisomerase|uniref:6-phospho-3-hexuloisomerase n=1 Tax=Pseudonocardia alni TaxID=33907 RepID=A0A852VWX3_PSEA5|nr:MULTISPECIES: 6-phospho-3-hexuloisomerase [Pseudonocardia]OJG08588.1 3-hexulose-6-phosphate isomerase [Pseudonocardia autotrophica]MBO4241529.1 SIS domain-containing protein [Pseudonocardia alni]MCO7196769.1 SIS domain-containing protein [Pseudonocardia sp. McavD-2-B]MYW72169.1 SIS domain-containing protein [Pseudonocardia sp. SID8383]NYG00619.1 6-phospho-3-hexuloisomerase [Pseudonocardia antarctica]
MTRQMTHDLTPGEFSVATRAVVDEVQRVSARIEPEAWTRAGALLLRARTVFTVGTGRSGLALNMAAMRFMHLGLPTHVVGEVTAPAIGAGDVLVAASGSGTTGRVVRAAETARAQDADVIALTTAAGSPLAEIATETLVVPAADKQDFDGSASVQYAGSLFEQSVLLISDALFHTLWKSGDSQARDLWRLHANLE